MTTGNENGNIKRVKENGSEDSKWIKSWKVFD
jgi:hypothetical protein